MESKFPRRRGRYVPTAYLRAFARGGEYTVDNLTLRCPARNALTAEQDFGREFVELAPDASEHESWATQPRA